jgi:hypothetical protein
MAGIVSSPDEAVQNIGRFERELKASATLQDRLPFARAWYAVRDDDGEWHFGPSKFIGYRGLSAEDYVSEALELDGRRTERQLGQWFTQLSPQDPLYRELNKRLGDFLDTYGKAASKLARINVSRDFHEDDKDGAADRVLADLVIAVAKRLPPAERARLKATL